MIKKHILAKKVLDSDLSPDAKLLFFVKEYFQCAGRKELFALSNMSDDTFSWTLTEYLSEMGQELISAKRKQKSKLTKVRKHRITTTASLLKTFRELYVKHHDTVYRPTTADFRLMQELNNRYSESKLLRAMQMLFVTESKKSCTVVRLHQKLGNSE